MASPYHSMAQPKPKPTATNTDNFLRQRLLQDIKELQEKPYPGVAVHIQDADITRACLVVRPQNERPLHMTMHFTPQYPLEPPEISMDSKGVIHPNIFDDYICVNILNREEAYTPAYTLKGLCIQMLSFFASRKIDQEEGYVLDRAEYQRRMEEQQRKYGSRDLGQKFQCKECGFGCAMLPGGGARACDAPMTGAAVKPLTTAAQNTSRSTTTATDEDEDEDGEKLELVKFPQDILLLFCDYLDEEDLALAARAWNGFAHLIRDYNIIHTRELECFTLKRNFNQVDLGIGVQASTRPRAIKSEFDLISRDAYEVYGVRRSIQGLFFYYWLPLPISEKHWGRVKKDIDERLNGIARAGGVQGTLETVIYSFMNEIVVQLSADCDVVETRRLADPGYYPGRYGHYNAPKSALTHASEKAIESYFQLFHLLLCLATERPSIADYANDMLKRFINGQQDKQAVPNLGHLLIMILISGIEVSEELLRALIKEAITRNVVWMLEPGPKGKGMPELSFMETSPISVYRLRKTFEAGKTSYRLFMFLNLMRHVIDKVRTHKDKDGNKQKMTLPELRNELFKRHGVPPGGAAGWMAAKIRKIQEVNDFREFLITMGLASPDKASFTAFLRGCVQDSMNKGYSKWALSQDAALDLRLGEEPGVEVPAGMEPRRFAGGRHFSFFPNDNRGGRGGGRGGSSGRGRGRGRGGY